MQKVRKVSPVDVVLYVHCVSKKNTPTFLAITRESIDGFL